jgi:hypothetical protein
MVFPGNIIPETSLANQVRKKQKPVGSENK